MHYARKDFFSGFSTKVLATHKSRAQTAAVCFHVPWTHRCYHVSLDQSVFSTHVSVIFPYVPGESVDTFHLLKLHSSWWLALQVFRNFTNLVWLKTFLNSNSSATFWLHLYIWFCKCFLEPNFPWIIFLRCIASFRISVLWAKLNPV